MELANSSNATKNQQLEKSVQDLRGSNCQLHAQNLALQGHLTHEHELEQLVQRIELKLNQEYEHAQQLQDEANQANEAQHALEEQILGLINRNQVLEHQAEDAQMELHDSQAAHSELEEKLKNLSMRLAAVQTRGG